MLYINLRKAAKRAWHLNYLTDCFRMDFVVPQEGLEPPTPSLRMLYFIIFYRHKPA